MGGAIDAEMLTGLDFDGALAFFGFPLLASLDGQVVEELERRHVSDYVLDVLFSE